MKSIDILSMFNSCAVAGGAYTIDCGYPLIGALAMTAGGAGTLYMILKEKKIMASLSSTEIGEGTIQTLEGESLDIANKEAPELIAS